MSAKTALTPRVRLAVSPEPARKEPPVGPALASRGGRPGEPPETLTTTDSSAIPSTELLDILHSMTAGQQNALRYGHDAYVNRRKGFFLKWPTTREEADVLCPNYLTPLEDQRYEITALGLQVYRAYLHQPIVPKEAGLNPLVIMALAAAEAGQVVFISQTALDVVYIYQLGRAGWVDLVTLDVHPDYPDMVVRIGATLTAQGRAAVTERRSEDETPLDA